MSVANDIMNDSNRYDRLQAEIDQYCKARGTLKLHGVKYLTMMLLDVAARIKLLECTPDDDYQSGAAALTRWRDIRARIVSTIRDKS